MSLSDPNFTEIKCVYAGQGRSAHLALSRADHSLVIVKKVNLRGLPAAEQEEILREAEILKVLSHPNIIRFRDFIRKDNDHVLIVMEYADGGDLHSRIQASSLSFFPEPQILDWFTQITLALKHMHDRKIVHRDIKSSNIFLTSLNVVKLGDFGISSVLGHTHDFLRSFAGTYFYLSPEIIANRPYNAKTDVWSLGIVLYELCAKKLPFNTVRNDKKLLESRIRAGKYEEIPLVYSQELRDLVGMLLRTDPLKRPSANEILRLPLIKRRISSFLNEAQMKDEFSHTVLHKKNVFSTPEKSTGLPTGLNVPETRFGPGVWGGAGGAGLYSARDAVGILPVPFAGGKGPTQIDPHPPKSEIPSDEFESPLARIRNELNAFLKKGPQGVVGNPVEVAGGKGHFKRQNTDMADVDPRKINQKIIKGNLEVQARPRDPKVQPSRAVAEVPKSAKPKLIDQLPVSESIFTELEEKIQIERRRKFYDKVAYLKHELKTAEDLKNNSDIKAKRTCKEEPLSNEKSKSGSKGKGEATSSIHRVKSVELSSEGTPGGLDLESNVADSNAERFKILNDPEVGLELVKGDQANLQNVLRLYQEAIEDPGMEPTIVLDRDLKRLSELQGVSKWNELIVDTYRGVAEEYSDLPDVQQQLQDGRSLTDLLQSDPHLAILGLLKLGGVV